jgi:Na+/H+-translocating membrane pyrophosphatase
MIREQLLECERLITTGAKAFLNKEYLYLGIFSTFFAIVLGATVD